MNAAPEGPVTRAGESGAPTPVLVAGAAGRLGRVACEAISSCSGLLLVGRILRGDDPARLLASRPAPRLLDVSLAEASRVLAPRAARAGLAVVVGTSGLGPDDDRRLDEAARAGGVPALRVPNFSLGAVLQVRACEAFARHMACLGIHEVHHVRKIDSPSGTSLHTAARIATARAAAGSADAAPPITSERRVDALAEQRVRFGDADEELSVEHVVRGRAAYVPGLLLALRRVGRLPPGLHVGLGAVLDLP